MSVLTNTQQSPYLSSSASHCQIPTVFTEVDLLDAQPWVITVWVKGTNLDNRYTRILMTTS